MLNLIKSVLRRINRAAVTVIGSLTGAGGFILSKVNFPAAYFLPVVSVSTNSLVSMSKLDSAEQEVQMRTLAIQNAPESMSAQVVHIVDQLAVDPLAHEQVMRHAVPSLVAFDEEGQRIYGVRLEKQRRQSKLYSDINIYVQLASLGASLLGAFLYYFRVRDSVNGDAEGNSSSNLDYMFYIASALMVLGLTSTAAGHLYFSRKMRKVQDGLSTMEREIIQQELGVTRRALGDREQTLNNTRFERDALQRELTRYDIRRRGIEILPAAVEIFRPTDSPDQGIATVQTALEEAHAQGIKLHLQGLEYLRAEFINDYVIKRFVPDPEKPHDIRGDFSLSELLFLLQDLLVDKNLFFQEYNYQIIPVHIKIPKNDDISPIAKLILQNIWKNIKNSYPQDGGFIFFVEAESMVATLAILVKHKNGKVSKITSFTPSPFNNERKKLETEVVLGRCFRNVFGILDDELPELCIQQYDTPTTDDIQRGSLLWIWISHIFISSNQNLTERGMIDQKWLQYVRNGDDYQPITNIGSIELDDLNDLIALQLNVLWSALNLRYGVKKQGLQPVFFTDENRVNVFEVNHEFVARFEIQIKKYKDSVGSEKIGKIFYDISNAIERKVITDQALGFEPLWQKYQSISQDKQDEQLALQEKLVEYMTGENNLLKQYLDFFQVNFSWLEQESRELWAEIFEVRILVWEAKISYGNRCELLEAIGQEDYEEIHILKHADGYSQLQQHNPSSSPSGPHTSPSIRRQYGHDNAEASTSGLLVGSSHPSTIYAAVASGSRDALNLPPAQEVSVQMPSTGHLMVPQGTSL